MGGGKVAVLIMLVVVMVGGGDAASSSLTTPNNLGDFASCMAECTSGCPIIICSAPCIAKCTFGVKVGGAAGDASSSLPTSPADHRRFCNLGCLASKCSSLIPNSGRVDRHDEAAVQDCARSCADVCSTSTDKLGLGLGRKQLV